MNLAYKLEDVVSNATKMLNISKNAIIEEEELNTNFIKNEEKKDEIVDFDIKVNELHEQNQTEGNFTLDQLIKQENNYQLSNSARDIQQASFSVNHSTNNFNDEHLFLKDEFTAHISEENYQRCEDNKDNIEIVEQKTESPVNNEYYSSTSTCEKNTHHTSSESQIASMCDMYPIFASGEESGKYSEFEYTQETKSNSLDSYKVFLSSKNTHILSKNHECRMCCKIFNRKFDLKVHINAVHEHIKSYECYNCHKLFAGKGCLKKHISAVHQKLKLHECNVCYKKFSLPGNLRRHISVIHMKIKNYECNVCVRKFSTKEKFQRHINGVHKKIKNFKCHECSKMFSDLSNLRMHIFAKHEGIKSYKCRVCYKLFSYRADLINHVNTIHKGRKYVCLDCNKTFSYSRGLKTHINIIHKGVRYKCNKCSQKFLYITTLKKHVKKAHK